MPAKVTISKQTSKPITRIAVRRLSQIVGHMKNDLNQTEYSMDWIKLLSKVLMYYVFVT